MLAKSHIIGVLLAGGKSRRFGSDKTRALLEGRPLIAHALDRASPQVGRLLISANETPGCAEAKRYEVLMDTVGPGRGPLAGVLSAFDWADAYPHQVSCIATFAVDCPFFPRDIVARLAEYSSDGRRAVIAASGGREHPVFGLWPRTCANILRSYLVDNGKSAVSEFAQTVGARVVTFDDSPYDPFTNINRPEELVRAEAMLVRGRMRN